MAPKLVVLAEWPLLVIFKMLLIVEREGHLAQMVEEVLIPPSPGPGLGC